MRSILSVLVLACLGTVCGAQEPERAPAAPDADFSGGFSITTRGGPAAVDADVFVNGEYAFTLGEENELFNDVPGLLKPGENSLRIVTKKPGAAREVGGHLEIDVRAVDRKATRTRTVGRPYLSVMIPDGVGPDAACEETFRFLLEPDPKPHPALKNRWYLFVYGPPSPNRVTVLVNGRPVWVGIQGADYVEITQHLQKGKNVVTFEGRPTCLARTDGKKDLLSLQIVPARMDGDTLQATDAPAAAYEVGPERRAEGFSVQRSFRAW